MKKQLMKSKANMRKKVIFLVCTFALLFAICTLSAFAADENVQVDGGAIVGEMVEILVSGISQVASGIGAGLSTLVQSIFLTSAGSLSVFGVVILAFGGISLALGLCYMVVNMLTSLGH